MCGGADGIVYRHVALALRNAGRWPLYIVSPSLAAIFLGAAARRRSGEYVRWHRNDWALPIALSAIASSWRGKYVVAEHLGVRGGRKPNGCRDNIEGKFHVVMKAGEAGVAVASEYYVMTGVI